MLNIITNVAIQSRSDLMKKDIENIINWLRTKVKDAKVNGLLVGISGGLDSAVVAYLIQAAFPNNSLGVIMPLKSNPDDITDAQSIINQSEISGMNIDLTDTHKLLYDSIQYQIKKNGTLNPQMDQLADANLRARLRMSTLYTIGANYNYLVTGTDNKSEWFTGYFTKYGDGGVDLQPLVEYTKGEVRELAQHLGVPKEIIKKQPSADLWEGQTDEREMGTNYDYIDAYLKDQPIPEKDKYLIENMNKQTMHKRHMPAQFKR